MCIDKITDELWKIGQNHLYNHLSKTVIADLRKMYFQMQNPHSHLNSNNNKCIHNLNFTTNTANFKECQQWARKKRAMREEKIKWSRTVRMLAIYRFAFFSVQKLPIWLHCNIAFKCKWKRADIPTGFFGIIELYIKIIGFFFSSESSI